MSIRTKATINACIYLLAAAYMIGLEYGPAVLAALAP